MSAQLRGCARECLMSCPQEGCVVLDLKNGCECLGAQKAPRC